MYHDQGLPVLKYASFGRGVNVTLGLPFVRTSVDHGTALDLAGTGTRRPGQPDRGGEACHRARIARVSGSASTFCTSGGCSRRSSTPLAPAQDDFIVEIGPGEGALTGPLLEKVAKLEVIELDRDLASGLAAKFPPCRLTVHCADALEFDFARFPPGMRLVGNLPYNISTPLLFHLARYAAAACATCISCCSSRWWSAWWRRLRRRPTAGSRFRCRRDSR